MPDTYSLKIEKQFQYKGKTEEWGNHYHFTGLTPADDAAWLTILTAMWNEEKRFLSNAVTVSNGYGYVAGSEISVFQVDFLADPPTVPQGELLDPNPAPGDAAVWVRWSTGEKNSKGRPIYGRKYFHGVPSSGGDQVSSAARTILEDWGELMVGGAFTGDFVVCGPQGAVYSNPKVAPFFGFRQLKRTGKRPTSG